MRLARLLVVVAAASCSSSPGGPGVGNDLAMPTGAQDGGVPDAAMAVMDAGASDAADAGYVPTYRTSLGVCWTDATCTRALSIAHGGDWSLTGDPYQSNAAIAAAYADGADGVKVDVRFTSDNVPVLSHSSPIEIYESLDCYNKKIEEMTAAEVTQCHRLPSSTEKFQRLDEVLAYARGKLVVQICVKVPAELPKHVASVLALGAEDFAFLEIFTADLQTQVPTITGGDKVWYLDQVNALTEVDTLLDTIKNPRAFMYEFDPSVDVSTLAPSRLHPAGIKSFTYDKDVSATPAIKAYFDAGFDVVSTNASAAGVQARIQENMARGISPP